MTLYRKKPVVIEARQFDGTRESAAALALWCGGREWTRFEGKTAEEMEAAESSVVITTLEGEMRATAGDWIIRGVKGEFYPCKPDIFEQTYEPVTETP